MMRNVTSWLIFLYHSGKERSSQVHCFLGCRISHCVLCCASAYYINICIDIMYAYGYSAKCSYCRKRMSSLKVCHSKHPLLLTSTLHLIWENQAIISFQVIVQIFYHHHDAFILQTAIKGLKCSQNNKLTGKV